MPKPSNPGGHGKGRGKHKGKGKPTINKWIGTWERVIIPAGETDADEIPLDTKTESVAILVEMFDDDGRKLENRPHVTAEETETGVVISTAEPVAQDTQILYEVVEDNGDDDDDDDDDLDDPVSL